MKNIKQKLRQERLGYNMAKLFSIIKKKTAQATLEVAMCSGVLLLMILGLYDVCSINIIRMEMQTHLQDGINAFATNSKAEETYIRQETIHHIVDHSVFCGTSNIGYSKKDCNHYTARYSVHLWVKTSKNNETQAGNEVCMEGRAQYRPLLPNIYGREMEIYTTACSVMEYNKAYFGYTGPASRGKRGGE